MAKKLAFMTIGVLHEPIGHPRVQGFVDRVPAVYKAADESAGFSARSVRDLQTLEHSWGPIRVPRCFAGKGELDRVASTLSIWNDLESVAAYAYHGAHGEAMAKRREWFGTHTCPTYVAWWIEEGHAIDWNETCERLDHLHEHGSTAFAFNFASPFAADGRPDALNQAAIRASIASNAARSG